MCKKRKNESDILIFLMEEQLVAVKEETYCIMFIQLDVVITSQKEAAGNKS